MNFVVVTPTYNELENIEILIRAVFGLSVKPSVVVIVDDNSPDGTATIVKKLSQEFPIRLLERKMKMRLGTAYRDAFKLILEFQEKPDYIVQMDADLSHNPSDIPRFLEAIENSDVILGSRYIKMGGVRHWGFMRRAISYISNIYARIILSIPFKDLTGGFKCWRREVLKNIDLEHTSSIGYNFQIETTFKAYKKGFRISEIPITFTERTFGKSKFSVPIIFESFWKILLLRFRK